MRLLASLPGLYRAGRRGRWSSKWAAQLLAMAAHFPAAGARRRLPGLYRVQLDWPVAQIRVFRLFFPSLTADTLPVGLCRQEGGI